MISNVIKTMMASSGIKQKDVAEALELKASAISNKFARDSFSLEELIVIAELCGYSISLTKENQTTINLTKEMI